MNNAWYFSKELSPSDELVDRFADSKFGINKWGSFAREIIQNSLDAQDDEGQPVEVVFDLNKSLKLADIPGGERIKDVLSKCESAATNRQTKSAYGKGIEILSKEFVYCMKISDFNTKGVKTGRDEAWGAFVYDEGRSIKQRPGAAGSHGVGKKVPFIISACNTVFYATKNKYLIDGKEQSDCLFEGKTALINWTESDGTRRNSKGWYGIVNEDADDAKNAVEPINASECEGINPYFLRTDKYGTDVIIVGANTYNNENAIKTHIISAVLENFFVAILNEKLIVDVMGQRIDKDNFMSVVKNFYKETDDAKNNLYGCLRVYGDKPEAIKDIVNHKGEKLGDISIYFGLGNENNKKYYTIVRSHGMRIRDNRVNKASQPYTAVVIINGSKLNTLLSSLENAAHDDFITKDENLDIDPEAVEAYEQICDLVKDYVIEQTSIDADDGQEITGLSNILSLPGMIPSVKKKADMPNIKKNQIPRERRVSKSKDYGEGTGAEGEGEEKRKKKKGKRKPAKAGDSSEGILYENFITEPTFIKNDDKLILRLSVNEDLSDVTLRFNSINSEGKQDNTINDYLDKITIEGVTRKCSEGVVKNVNLKAKKEYRILIHLKRNITYQLNTQVRVKEMIPHE